jgi:hypothetical protein
MSLPLSKSRRFAVFLAIAVAIFHYGDCSALAKAPQSKSKTISSPAKALPQEYYLAIKAFNDGKYKDALGQFQHLDENGHCCDKVHYFIAQSYQGMNQTVPAQMHYEWVSSYSHDPVLKYYSDVALDRLSYYRGHRTYAGNGNNFSRITASASSSGFG